MAISEVCKFEVKIEIDRLCKDKGISRNEAARELAAFYKDVVGVPVDWQTIKKKDQRVRGVGTYVPNKRRARYEFYERPRLDDAVRQIYEYLLRSLDEINSTTSKAKTDSILFYVREDLRNRTIMTIRKLIPKLELLVEASEGEKHEAPMTTSQPKKLIGFSRSN